MRRFFPTVLVAAVFAGIASILTRLWDLIPQLALIHISAFCWVVGATIFYKVLIVRLQHSRFHEFASRGNIDLALQGKPQGTHAAMRAFLKPTLWQLRLLRDGGFGVLVATAYNAVSGWLTCLC